MANFATRRWTRRLIALGLLLILVCLLGHCLADATGISVDSLVTLDLHGHFIAWTPLTLGVLFIITVISCWLDLQPIHWSIPPTTPPPINQYTATVLTHQATAKWSYPAPSLATAID